ncbi:MAG: hypothetical protein HY268_02480 [Deltaproteobacteria bacterium]|nr:hypothetical protein [Deltaproteobacteria bacterium]
MRSISHYFDLISSVAERSGAASADIELNQRDPALGTVKGVLFFYDGSRLEFSETVAIERYRPVKLFYTYQYVRDGEAVLRYDNAPHHPDLPNFPHHKHARKERLPATEPTLSQVLSEVATLLGEGPAGTPRGPRRRRTKR